MRAVQCVREGLQATGHIVIVDSVTSLTQFDPTEGRGVRRITVQTFEAGTDSGANSRQFTAEVGATDFLRLHLLELHPGGDPDTLQGLRNLNVAKPNTNTTGSTDWRATASFPIDRDPNGNAIAPTQWCHDNHPSVPSLQAHP